MLLRITLLLALLSSPALAAAQADVLVLHASEDPSVQGDDLRGWVAAIVAHLHTTHVLPLDATDCWPEAPGCALALARSAGARRILLVRVLWELPGSVAVHQATSHGDHPLVRRSVLDVILIDAHGHTVAHQTRPAPIPDADRRAAVRDMARAIHL